MNPLKITQNKLATLPKPHKLIVGCSGGVDSVVLVHILKQLGCDLTIAHFNHGWREKESDGDEIFVQNLAKTWDLSIEIGRGQKPTQGNAENQARIVRYQFLEEIRQKHSSDYIAVGHHQDDQIETIFMHQKRGAGLRGLVGMPFQRGNLIRPLLQISKKELIDYAKAHQLEWREDASNQNLNFTRNQLRQVEIPKLRAKDPNFEKKLLEKSKSARQKLEKLQKTSKKWLKIHLKDKIFLHSTFLKLENELQGEILIQLLGPVDVYQVTLKSLKNWIKEGQSGTKVTIKGKTFWKEHDSIYLEFTGRRDSPISPTLVAITKKGIVWGSWHLKNLSNQALFVRPWQTGDRFKPNGMKGSKKVQDFFVDEKIPLHQRGQIPLILDEKGVIVAVGNLRVARGEEKLKKTLINSPYALTL